MKGTRETILRTARKLFGRDGLKKTTMDSIAATAHIGKGTIYHYYDSKEQLFCDILEQDAEMVSRQIENAIKAASGPADKLRAYFVTRTRHMGGIARFYETFRDEYTEYYAYIKKVHRKYQDAAMQILKMIFNDGIAKGVFDIKDLDTTILTAVECMKALE